MTNRDSAVDQHVAPEGAARERPAALLEQEQAGEDQGLRAGFVELRRVQVHVERRAGVGQRERIGEDDAPRHRGLLAVAAAGQEAAEPADDVAEGDARREDVRRRPHRQLVPADVPQRDDDGQDQPAVEDAARLRQREQLRGVAREQPPVLVEQQQLGADQGADDDPDAQVHHPVTVQAAGPGADERQPQAGQIAERQQESVAVEGDGAELKQAREHGIRFGACRRSAGRRRTICRCRRR